MKTYFSIEMIVIPEELTIPAHQKMFRFMSALKGDRNPQITDDFLRLNTEQWTGIHNSDYVHSVFSGAVVWNLAGGYTPPKKSNSYDLVVKGHLNTYDCAIRHFG